MRSLHPRYGEGPTDAGLGTRGLSDWTPTFAIIGGLVLASGSLSQHAAIMAREYRISAVMMAEVASTVIGDGRRIVVDADDLDVEM